MDMDDDDREATSPICPHRDGTDPKALRAQTATVLPCVCLTGFAIVADPVDTVLLNRSTTTLVNS